MLSREALRRFGQREPTACKNDTGAEDVAFGHCMLAVGVRTKSSLDSLGIVRIQFWIKYEVSPIIKIL